MSRQVIREGEIFEPQSGYAATRDNPSRTSTEFAIAPLPLLRNEKIATFSKPWIADDFRLIVKFMATLLEMGAV